MLIYIPFSKKKSLGPEQATIGTGSIVAQDAAT
jgi:hypothetical protein